VKDYDSLVSLFEKNEMLRIGISIFAVGTAVRRAITVSPSLPAIAQVGFLPDPVDARADRDRTNALLITVPLASPADVARESWQRRVPPIELDASTERLICLRGAFDR
jgi:hypothetical protein